MYICIYIPLSLYIYIYIYICTYKYTFTHTHTHIYIHIHIHIYIYICIRIYSHSLSAYTQDMAAARKYLADFLITTIYQMYMSHRLHDQILGSRYYTLGNVHAPQALL